MSQQNIHFGITEFKEIAPGVMVPISYQHWEPLVDYFLSLSNRFSIHCWNEEVDSINSIKPYAERFEVKQLDDNLVSAVSDALATSLNRFEKMREQGKHGFKEGMAILEGNINTDFKAELLTHSLDKYGRLQWFYVLLKDNDTTIFSSEHYGTEFVAFGVTEEDIVFIQSVMPKDASFNIYTYS
ncbi:MAG: hypothetical protein APF84_13775 [Gracilibacter sp. BRH_c7a]|nr:MAG: hypothetical protein APF84_13775 [Gracilibacter sp. BRH_c7a]